MKKRKPLGWPDYMEAKPSKGVVRYYWNAPSWARKRGCPIKSEALGADYASQGAMRYVPEPAVRQLAYRWRDDLNVNDERRRFFRLGNVSLQGKPRSTPTGRRELAPAMIAPSHLSQTID